MEKCNDCETPRTCETNQICDLIEEAKKKFLEISAKKTNRLAYEQSKVKLQIYEYKNKVYFNSQGNKYELANLLFEILVSEPNNDFLQVYNQYIQAKFNHLNKIQL